MKSPSEVYFEAFREKTKRMTLSSAMGDTDDMIAISEGNLLARQTLIHHLIVERNWPTQDAENLTEELSTACLRWFGKMRPVAELRDELRNQYTDWALRHPGRK